MIFYFSIIMIASCFAGIANTQKHKNKVFTFLLFFISAFIMFIPLAMRDVGVDYDEYYKGYVSTSVSWSTYWKNYLGRPEPLYGVLNYCARWIFNKYQGVNFLCALISITFTFAGIYKFKDKINIGIAIWCFGYLYYIMMYGLNRMMIAVSLITWAWHYYFQKNGKLFILFSIIAGLFHYSALLMIPFYFIIRKMENRNNTFTITNCFRIVLSITLIMIMIYKIIPMVFGGYYWFGRYAMYFKLSFTLAALNNNAATYLILVLVFIYNKSLSEYLSEYKMLITIIMIYFFLSLACIIMPIHRITYYFYPICVVLYSTIPQAGILAERRKNKLVIINTIYSLGILFMGVLWIYQFMNSYLWGKYLLPYKWGEL